MCGRLSQYRGIHDFVAVLSIPDALINHVGDQPLARYNAAPTTQLALLHREDDGLHADAHGLPTLFRSETPRCRHLGEPELQNRGAAMY